MFKLNVEHKKLLKNFMSLTLLQGVNLILPLIILPYIIRIIGIEKFGLINYALAIIMYFNILVSFGFDLSATKEISVFRYDKEKIKLIFNSVIIIKLILTFFSLIILFILSLIFNKINDHFILFFLTFGLVIGNVLFPSWFFQGIEEMQYITIVNIIPKIIFTLMIFIFVHKPSDYLLVPLLNSLGIIVSGIWSLYIIYVKYNIKFKVVSLNHLYKQFKKSYPFFLSRVANNGSRYYAITMIGAFFGNTLLGYYVLVEKLYFAMLGIVGVISQTIFPYMSREKNILFFKRLIILISFIFLVFLMILIFQRGIILYLLFHIKNETLSNIFLIEFSGMFFAVISILIGNPLLAALGYVKYANYSLIYASFIYILYITLITLIFKNIYLTVSSLVVYAFFGFLIRMYYIYKLNILKKDEK